MTRDPKNDRWTCPNDRNLQLRSKLNAGWSIHTGKKTLKKDPQLSETELIEIQKVLERSEMLERNERDRVMKLVDRLENLKRNVTQNGCTPSPNRCALCGDFFCLIRTAPNQCGSCQKILCNKCCIDTECTIDNDTSSNPSQSRRNSSNSITIPTSFISSGNSNKVTVYLCRICSEQREFLKKSGAWFIKKYPNYLATNGEKYNSTSNISQLEKSPSQLKQLSHASPLCLKRNISSSSSNSSSYRFWKFKDNVQNYVNDISDNVSDMSNENDRVELDTNSNYDSNSVTTRTASSENLNLNLNSNSNSKTPTSPNKKQEHFLFTSNSTPVQSQPNNSNNNILKSKPVFSPSQSSPVNDKKMFNPIFSSNQVKTSNSSSNATSLSNKDKEKVFQSDDETPSSPNMTSYNYYSNIITNLNPTSSLDIINNCKSKNTEKSNSINDLDDRNDKPVINSKSDNLKLNKSNKINLNTLGLSHNKSQIQSNGLIKTKKISNTKSITNGIVSNALSTSASNLDSNYPSSCLTSPRLILKSESNNNRCLKKSKVSEWCSTQLSMDDDNDNHDHAFKLKPTKNGNSVSDINFSIENINNSGYNSPTNSKNVKAKISAQTVNNLAKKIISHNNSILPVGSIAASSSSAVSSASSLATSLTKLNFK